MGMFNANLAGSCVGTYMCRCKLGEVLIFPRGILNYFKTPPNFIYFK